jgi:putative ATP-dependent endonuclease of OLD family
VLVSSEQNLSYQLSYATKYTLLSKVSRAFHDKLISDQDRVDRLKGLFDDIVDTFGQVEEFTYFKENMSLIAGDMISNMSHGLQLDFSAYDPSNYFKSLRVHPCDKDEVRTFEEIGTGQQQILALSFAHAYAKSFKGQGLVLLIDEPEAHLHPLAQKWLAKTMFQMARDGLQIVITTHSPYFINLEYLEGMHLVRKTEDGTYIKTIKKKQLADFCIEKGADSNRTNAETIIPFYTGNATDNILKGFFANKIVLVEGLTEEFALPVYLQQVGLDTLKEGIDIISVGGKGNLAKWWRLFSFFKIPTFVCFDNDSKDDKDKNKRRDALIAIGIVDEEIEDLLTSEDWNINDKFCVFGKNFEVTMGNSFTDYADIEAQKKAELGGSKPIIAREVAKLIQFNRILDGWEQYRKLALMIRNINI